MEEENKKNQPNLPSNYVTLLQLKERWMKQQKRKEEEEEEEKSDVVLVNNEKSKGGGKGMKNKNYYNKKEKSEKEGKREENENTDVEPEVKKSRNRCERGKIVRKKKGGDDAAEKSDRTVEIAEKLESVKVDEENEVSRREKSGYIGKNNGYNGNSGNYNGRYGRRNGEFGGYGRDFGRNGNQKAWVKKEHVVGVKDGKLS